MQHEPMIQRRIGGATNGSVLRQCSTFPDITSGQRMTLKRLKEGPLLLCTFTDDFAHRDAMGAVTGAKTQSQMKGMPFPQPDGTTQTGYGLVAALSYDDDVTWPVRRLVTPSPPPENPSPSK
jgi:hypothetical protein